jgi:DNA polymerase I-like protein with 3'-5' exonuclease and polymerase domains
MKWKVVSDLAELTEITAHVRTPIACDIETKGKYPRTPSTNLIGFSFSSNELVGFDAIYVPLVDSSIGKSAMASPLSKWKLVGHNRAFDKNWIDYTFGINSNWEFDTRLGWQLSDREDLMHGFSLGKLQTDLLGWPESKKTILDAQIKARGGEPGKDIWMADLPLIAEYACYDAHSTYLGYKKLLPFFEKYSYLPYIQNRMAYDDMLRRYEEQGIPLSSKALLQAKSHYEQASATTKTELRTQYAPDIEALESELSYSKSKKGSAMLKTEKGRVNRNLNIYRYHRDFNPGSTQQRAVLLYDKWGLPITEVTEKGAPSTAADVIRRYQHPGAQLFARIIKELDNAKYCKMYLESIDEQGSIHPPLNICGTVSGRLACFSPNTLNPPFKEELIMQAFTVPDEYEGGIHADLKAVEPCLTAHYSDDETLLKVFRDGLGDIYLDLALEIFPDHIELQHEYNPQSKDIDEAKKKFKSLRDICKIIHLALQYTGTQYTIARQLTFNGYPTTPQEALRHVRAYWRKFKKVEEFGQKLKKLYDKQGYVVNAAGRVIFIPDRFKKDLLNRFIQSGGHDVLVMWVMEICRLSKERDVILRPWLPDTHDATTFFYPPGRYDDAKEIYEEALKTVNKTLELEVEVKCDIKKVTTLANIKND